MSFEKFLRWPNRLRVAVHLQRADELSVNKSPTGLSSNVESSHAPKISSLSQRKTFVAGRSVLRQVLSSALDCAPESVSILRHANGKPGILRQGIQYNISQCENWCAVAWSAEGAVGVAVDVIRPVPGMKDIVSDFFPPIAQRAFHAAAAQHKTQVFFYWWTQIEAALKASGGSLDDSHMCLDQVLHGICEEVPGVSLAVAVVGAGPLTITWHLP